MTDEASPLEPYNTISRARAWYHANAGLEGEGAVGRRHLGWVLEVLYELQNRTRGVERDRDALLRRIDDDQRERFSRILPSSAAGEKG